MSLLRAFIAIEIPVEIKQAIAVQSAGLQKNAGRSVRWVTPENIHLTLKFLGDISPTNLELLCQALQAECSQHAPFEISVGGLGCFPNPHRPRIIWVGLEIPPELNRLQHKLENATAKLGYASEEKAFSPHLTIGRVREQAEPSELHWLGTALKEAQIGQLGSFVATTVQVFKSDLQPSGPIYSSLFSAHLDQSKKDEN